MSTTELQSLASAVGLAREWEDYRGTRHDVPDETLRAILAAMELPCATAGQLRDSLRRAEEERAAPPVLLTAVAGEPWPHAPGALLGSDGAPHAVTTGAALAIEPGYYRWPLDNREVTVAVAPSRARAPSARAPGARPWGLSAQLYALRRRGDGGVGDYTALASLAQHAAAAGADALALSPVHAPFAADPSHYSPYAPSSRLFLNPWHVDPAELVGADGVRALIEETGVGAELARLEAEPLVDWRNVVRVRHALLERLYGWWRADRLPRALTGAFADFRRKGGPALEDHARFEMLQARSLALGGPWHWREWRDGLDDARSAPVREAARASQDAVSFHAFLQWLAARGLAAAQQAARAGGMGMGLIADLAVGTHDGGSHAWSHRHDLLVGLSVGAPPDEFNAQGQSWGLTTFSPRALRASGYAPFLELLRAALRHSGGLRIDHVLGLNRLWLVPHGAPATAGAYLRYPLDDLLRLIALESWLHNAVIIGEDLGTVPAGFRDRLGAAGVLGLRVLWFEREHDLFVEPSRWTPAAAAMTTTHDLPTVAGWWLGRDVEWRARLGHCADDGAAARAQRARDRRALWDAFAYARLADGAPPAEPAPVVDAAVAFVARARCALALLPLEDVVGLEEQPNLPGTVDEHPNWRRRLPAPAEELLAAPAATARLAAVRRERETP